MIGIAVIEGENGLGGNLNKKKYGIFHGMRYSDFLFLWILFVNLLLVVYLGVGNHQKALKIAYTQTSGEQIVAWFEGFNQMLEEGKPIVQKSCIPLEAGLVPSKGSKANIWKDCVGSLFMSGGPFDQYTNLLMPKAPPYANKCDKHDLGSSGAFIFEKLTINPAGPPAIAPMEAGEKLVSGLNIRLSICDTGYYLIKIGEFKL